MSFFLVSHRILSFFVSCFLRGNGGMLLVSLAKIEEFYMELVATSDFLAVPEQLLFVLRRLSTPVYLSGYRCLCIAIPIFAKDIAQSMCNELYPAVAKELGYVDWRAVEFAIRRTILAAWEHRTPEIWEEYFPGITRVPTNKQFIATLAQQIK